MTTPKNVPSLFGEEKDSVPIYGRWIEALGGDMLEVTGAVLYIRATSKGTYELHCISAGQFDAVLYEGTQQRCVEEKERIVKATVAI